MTSPWRRLDAEHGTLRRQGREGIRQRRAIFRQAIQPLKERYTARHLTREGTQDRDTLLDEGDPCSGVNSHAQRVIDELYGPIGQAGLARLMRYSAAELVFLRDFLREGYAFQVEQAERIRGSIARSGDDRR